MTENSKNKINTWIKETKGTVNSLSQNFLRKKAADRYARARVSKKGVIDAKKLASFKVRDDLFKSVTKLSDGKSHGMVFLLDYSGSMINLMESILKQTFMLCRFCREVGIPFEVYGYTNGQSEISELDQDAIYIQNTKVFEITNDTLSKRQFEASMAEALAPCYDGFICSSDLDTLVGTPTHEALIIVESAIADFRARTRVDKVIFNVLTDGAPNGCRLNGGYGHRYSGEKIMWDGVQVGATNSRRDWTGEIVEEIKRRNPGTIAVSYFAFERLSMSVCKWNKGAREEAKKSFRKGELVVESPQICPKGYDAHFLVTGGNLDEVEEKDFSDLDLTKKANRNKIAKQFAKSKTRGSMKGFIKAFTDLIS